MLKKDGIDNILSITSKLNENPFKYQHFDKTGKYTIDAEYKKNILQYIEKYIDEFKNIIVNSPKLTRPIKVFRGIQNNKYLLESVKINNGNEYIINDNFISTSFYLESATYFMKNRCCLLDLTLDTSTPCLLTAHISRCGTEYEITLAPDTIMRGMDNRRKLLLNSPEHYVSQDIFIQPLKFVIPRGNVYEFTVFSNTD
jgi:predicted nucleic acid-binding Zn finger protein